jgi:hypothetical protein
MRANEHPLLWMHKPFEMTFRTFGVQVRNAAVLPGSRDNEKQQRRKILADVFEDDV